MVVGGWLTGHPYSRVCGRYCGWVGGWVGWMSGEKEKVGGWEGEEEEKE